MFANTDHTLDSTLAPATNAAGPAPPSSAPGSATVGSGGGHSNGTAGTGNQPPVQLTEDGKCPSDRPECYNHNLDANGRLKPGAKFYSKRETTPDGLRYIVVRVSDGKEFSVAYSSKKSVGAAIQDVVAGENRLGKPRGMVNAAQQDIADARALGRAQDKKLAAAEAKLSSADVEMGGTGKTPSAQPLSAATPVECAICTDEDDLVTPGSKDSITSLCGHTFHASCYTKWIVRKPNCPVCRKTLAPAPVAADDDAASDDIMCNVCGDGTDGDNNPILMCSGPHPTQHGSCDVAMHMKCLDRPPVSCIGVNCWCSQHWHLASRGDIKLEATAGTSSARTTASDRAARAAGRSGAACAKSDQPKNRAHMKLRIARRLRKKHPKSLVNQCLRLFGKKPMKHCDNFERLAGLLLTPV